MALWPARYGAEHPVNVRFAPTEAERRHKSGAQASRYANIEQKAEPFPFFSNRISHYCLLWTIGSAFCHLQGTIAAAAAIVSISSDNSIQMPEYLRLLLSFSDRRSGLHNPRLSR